MGRFSAAPNVRGNASVVLISGPVAAGKTTLTQNLQERQDWIPIRTRDLILEAKPRTLVTRQGLQSAGDELDRETGGSWVADRISDLLLKGAERPIVVDSVHQRQQIDAVRHLPSVAVFHIHVTAVSDVLARRYEARRNHPGELPNYDLVRRNETEARIESLAASADLVIDSGYMNIADAVAATAALVEASDLR